MSLSGGERRRVEIARALATDRNLFCSMSPLLVLILFPLTISKILLSILCNKGIGVLITDHNVRETLDICSRAYIIGEGHVIAEGTTDDVLSNSKVRETYLRTFHHVTFTNSLPFH